MYKHRTLRLLNLYEKKMATMSSGVINSIRFTYCVIFYRDMAYWKTHKSVISVLCRKAVFFCFHHILLGVTKCVSIYVNMQFLKTNAIAIMSMLMEQNIWKTCTTIYCDLLYAIFCMSETNFTQRICPYVPIYNNIILTPNLHRIYNHTTDIVQKSRVECTLKLRMCSATNKVLTVIILDSTTKSGDPNWR